LKSNNCKIFELTLELIKPQVYTTDLDLILQVKKLQPIHNFLLERVQEDNEQIRVEAIYKLGCFDFVEVKYKLRQLTEDINPKIQAYAAYALGKIGDRSDIPLLITKLKHPKAIVREGVVNGLRLMGSELAKHPLIEALEDLSEENIHVKNSIIQALGVIGGEDIEEYLIQLAQNTNDFAIVNTIISILGILGGEKTVRLLKHFPDEGLEVTKQENYLKLPDIETVILALERINNNLAIEVLVDIAQYSSYPYSQANLSLARVGKLETILSLWEITLKTESMGLLDAISHIQECYQHYNPNYCQVNPKNIKKNLIVKNNNNYENYLSSGYPRLSDCRTS
ncbi:MAG: HEAT repeat domain-containing protein, partial [Cyanobacteria bacterium P01_F01_bin.143]